MMSAVDSADPLKPLPSSYGSVAGQLVYAVGDVHGRYDLLYLLLAKVEEDTIARAGGRTPVLIFCGDYVDRGPDSARVLDALCWLKRHSTYDVRFLKGNHEQVMLDYIRDPSGSREWMDFGGAQTLMSYGVQPPLAEDDVSRHWVARDDLLERLPAAHLRFLEQLDLLLTIGDYAFVHAGIRPGKPLVEQSTDDLLWIRQDFLSSHKAHEKIVVHGHTWFSDQPALLANRIGIDTGAYETGVLSAVRLEDGAATILAVAGDARPQYCQPDESSTPNDALRSLRLAD